VQPHSFVRQSQQLLLAERSRIKEQWRRKTERSPFLVNLIAQTERQEEEMRLRSVHSMATSCHSHLLFT